MGRRFHYVVPRGPGQCAYNLSPHCPSGLLAGRAGAYFPQELQSLQRGMPLRCGDAFTPFTVRPQTATRWAEAILNLPHAGDALAAIGRRTEDPTRDLPHATRENIRRKIEGLPHADRMLTVLEGDEEDDTTLGRIFGEELPSGLVLAE